MRILGYWVVRAALMLCVLLALWAVGWRNWSAVIGAVLLSWLIAYGLFGSQHDPIAERIERYLEERALRKGKGEGAKG